MYAHLLPNSGDAAVFGLGLLLVMLVVYLIFIIASSESFKDDPDENYFYKVARVLQGDFK